MNERMTSTVSTTSRRSVLAGGASVLAAASLASTAPATAAEHTHSSVSPSKGTHSMSTITTKDGTNILPTRTGAADNPWYSAMARLSADAFEDQMFFRASPDIDVSRTTAGAMVDRVSLGPATTWIPTPTISPN